MLSKKELLDYIFEQTGLPIEDRSYGFIIGTHTPYAGSGFLSSSNTPGYFVWKLSKDKIFKVDVSKSYENQLEQIIGFLKS